VWSPAVAPSLRFDERIHKTRGEILRSVVASRGRDATSMPAVGQVDFLAAVFFTGAAAFFIAVFAGDFAAVAGLALLDVFDACGRTLP
jgi:hypothetical protein